MKKITPGISKTIFSLAIPVIMLLPAVKAEGAWYRGYECWNGSSGELGPYSSEDECDSRSLSDIDSRCTTPPPLGFNSWDTSCQQRSSGGGGGGGGSGGGGSAVGPETALDPGQVNLDNFTGGKPFFTTDNYSEFGDWVRESQERWRMYLALNRKLKAKTKLPELKNKKPAEKQNMPEIASALPSRTQAEKETYLTYDEMNRNLMMLQWKMSITPRYLTDKDVRKNIERLWKNKEFGKLWDIIFDQMKGEGRSEADIKNFRNAFNGFCKLPGFQNTVDLSNASDLAKDLDAPQPQRSARTNQELNNRYYNSLFMDAGKYADLESASASASSVNSGSTYMDTKSQQNFDCALYAVANGTQISYDEIRRQYNEMMKNEAARDIGSRENPDNVIEDPGKGGKGGLYAIELMTLAGKVGTLQAVEKDNFAQAIEQTGSPVIAMINTGAGNHWVAVTGAFKKDGWTYYSVMDSNVNTGANPHYNNYTTYWAKSDFEYCLITNGLVVTPKNRQGRQ